MIPTIAVIGNARDETLKITNLNTDKVTVEFTEFELMALTALVERGQTGVEEAEGDYACIRSVINTVADEFRSLPDHFDLAA